MRIIRTRKKARGIAPLFFRFLGFSTLLWTLVLGVTLAVTLRYSMHFLQEKIERGLVATATTLAESDMVYGAFENGYCSPGLITYLDSLIANNEDLDIITLADRDSIRLYHVVHERIGLHFVGGDEGRALQGQAYMVDGVGTLGLQRRAFQPIFDREDGSVLGFVVASTTMNQIDDLRGRITGVYINLAALMVAVTLMVSGLLSLYIRRMLHGHAPEELVHTYLAQSDVLNNLDEGVVLVDASGRVQLTNRAAEGMLGQSMELLEHTPLDELIRSGQNESLLTAEGENLATSRPNVLANSVGVVKNEKRTGTALILKDRSEAMRQAEQLNGTRHIVSALRANSHEFMNKLQVISGLLQMDRPKDALRYIADVSAVQAKAIGPILQLIQNPNVAALLLGKLDNARELDIRLTLLANSSLPEHSRYLSTKDLVTLIGNLVENAMEAVNARKDDGPRSIALQITEDDSGLLISVSDTGTGIFPENLDRIYESGFSTKAKEGRGVGMSLVRELMDRCGGSIEVDSDPEDGTLFTVICSRERERKRG